MISQSSQPSWHAENQMGICFSPEYKRWSHELNSYLSDDNHLATIHSEKVYRILYPTARDETWTDWQDFLSIVVICRAYKSVSLPVLLVVIIDKFIINPIPAHEAIYIYKIRSDDSHSINICSAWLKKFKYFEAEFISCLIISCSEIVLNWKLKYVITLKRNVGCGADHWFKISNVAV